MVKAGSQDLAATGDWTPVTGDTKISKDGGNVTNTSNNPSAVGGTGSVLWNLTLTAAEMQATEIHIQIVDSATKAVEDQVLTLTTKLGGWIASNKGIIVGEVDNTDFTADTTDLEGLRIAPNSTEETTSDHYIGRLMLFTSGVALGELTTITDYVLANSKEKFTYDAIISTPGDGDTYVVI
jgi:sporulation protein YlmC with PRC-barrel domain